MNTRYSATCAFCGAEFSRRQGTPPKYCSQACFGASRRKLVYPLTLEQHRERIAAKAQYDAARRERLGQALLDKKRAHYYATHEEQLKRQAARRKTKAYQEYMAEHGPRWRARSEWKAHKKRYDRILRAKRDYGPLWEAQVALLDLEDEIRSQGDRKALAQERGHYNKALRRKRHGERAGDAYGE